MVGNLGRDMEAEVVGGGWDPVSGSPAWPSPGPEIIIGTEEKYLRESDEGRDDR